MGKYAIVILAAGTSSRLGSPKQLLFYNGKNLLLHAVDVALETGCQSVFIVLGAHMELLRNELKEKPLFILENDGWQEGLASSIRCGLENVTKTMQGTDHIIFMLCDQPFVSSSLLLKLIEKRNETGMPVVASSYGDCLGTPALFYKNLFPALMELKGDKGARNIISNNPGKVAVVQFPGGIYDIDTVADYELLKKGNQL